MSRKPDFTGSTRIFPFNLFTRKPGSTRIFPFNLFTRKPEGYKNAQFSRIFIISHNIFFMHNMMLDILIQNVWKLCVISNTLCEFFQQCTGRYIYVYLMNMTRLSTVLSWIFSPVNLYKGQTSTRARLSGSFEIFIWDQDSIVLNVSKVSKPNNFKPRPFPKHSL